VSALAQTYYYNVRILDYHNKEELKKQMNQWL